MNSRGDVSSKVRRNWEKNEDRVEAYVVVEKGNLRRREMKNRDEEEGEVGIWLGSFGEIEIVNEERNDDVRIEEGEKR